MLILSVGGGNIKKKVSMNIVEALKLGKKRKCKILGLVGRDGGYAKKIGDNVVVIKVKKKKRISNSNSRIFSGCTLAFYGVSQFA